GAMAMVWTKEEILALLDQVEQDEYDRSPLLWHAHRKFREIAAKHEDMNQLVMEWQASEEYKEFAMDEANKAGADGDIDDNEVFTPVMTLDEGLEILPEYGICYTEAQFQERLRQLAVIAGIEVFPVGEFFAFLTGALITNPPISEQLYNNRERILDDMKKVEGTVYEIKGEPFILLYEEGLLRARGLE
ncbi:MAG: hypothetical protein K0Q63_1637, partial [Paenibacillus sp.]|nr:hypothetical protein [Paenibacillus sp.]